MFWFGFICSCCPEIQLFWKLMGIQTCKSDVASGSEELNCLSLPLWLVAVIPIRYCDPLFSICLLLPSPISICRLTDLWKLEMLILTKRETSEKNWINTEKGRFIFCACHSGIKKSYSSHLIYGTLLLLYICPDTCLSSTLSKCPEEWLIFVQNLQDNNVSVIIIYCFQFPSVSGCNVHRFKKLEQAGIG